MKSILGSLLLGLATTLAVPASAQDVKPFKIGVLTDLSGPFSSTTGMGSVVGARLAVEDFGGKVLGRPIEIVFADHTNKADVATEVARRWYEQEGVSAIADGSGSSTALAIHEVARSLNKVYLASSPATLSIAGKDCSPTTIHFTYDSYSLATGLVAPIIKAGGDTWFFLTADYAGGKAMQDATSGFVTRLGGKVIGSALSPLNSTDWSAAVLAAQASQAKVVVTATGGSDTINAIKQASEFGLTQGDTKMAAAVLFASDIKALGLEAGQGLQASMPFYWDMSEATREFSKRFQAQMNDVVPDFIHAGAYTAVLHYLKAVQAAGTDDPAAVIAKMKATPVNDFWNKDIAIREDGRVLHDVYLLEAKTPSESKYPNDFFKIVSTVPGKDAFRPMDQGGCPLVKKS